MELEVMKISKSKLHITSNFSLVYYSLRSYRFSLVYRTKVRDSPPLSKNPETSVELWRWCLCIDWILKNLSRPMHHIMYLYHACLIYLFTSLDPNPRNIVSEELEFSFTSLYHNIVSFFCLDFCSSLLVNFFGILFIFL